jgi:ribosome maturation factor RimP|tara:strand:+ start:881 stop:1408 length:528 start_codon:yes stop_codon:yes gene_type:complete
VVNEEGRGLKSPLFLYFILRFNMNQTAVKDIVDIALALNESLYLIELSISVNNKVQVVVDGDNGVSLSECMRISRVINDNFDREVEDFSLEVTTPDIAHPLKVKRQYIKNLNRILKVKTAEEEIEGTLVTADEDKIVLQWKAREPKPVGKGNVTVEKTVTLEYTEIKEAKVKILF